MRNDEFFGQIFKENCPHCFTKHVAFTINDSCKWGNRKGERRNSMWDTFATCGACGRGVIATFGPEPYWDAEKRVPTICLQNNSGPLKNYHFRGMHPSPSGIEALEGIPEIVGVYFEQGVNNVSENYDAAGTMFRKSLESALKIKFPEITDRPLKLIDLIRKSERQGGLTPDMAKWADTIRILGNDSAHGENPFSRKEAETLHQFTHLILLYLFTLPSMLEKAQINSKDNERN